MAWESSMDNGFRVLLPALMAFENRLMARIDPTSPIPAIDPSTKLLLAEMQRLGDRSEVRRAGVEHNIDLILTGPEPATIYDEFAVDQEQVFAEHIYDEPVFDEEFVVGEEPLFNAETAFDDDSIFDVERVFIEEFDAGPVFDQEPDDFNTTGYGGVLPGGPDITTTMVDRDSTASPCQAAAAYTTVKELVVDHVRAAVLVTTDTNIRTPATCSTDCLSSVADVVPVLAFARDLVVDPAYAPRMPVTITAMPNYLITIDRPTSELSLNHFITIGNSSHNIVVPSSVNNSVLFCCLMKCLSLSFNIKIPHPDSGMGMVRPIPWPSFNWNDSYFASWDVNWIWKPPWLVIISEDPNCQVLRSVQLSQIVLFSQQKCGGAYGNSWLRWNSMMIEFSVESTIDTTRNIVSFIVYAKEVGKYDNEMLLNQPWQFSVLLPWRWPSAWYFSWSLKLPWPSLQFPSSKVSANIRPIPWPSFSMFSIDFWVKYICLWKPPWPSFLQHVRYAELHVIVVLISGADEMVLFMELIELSLWFSHVLMHLVRANVILDYMYHWSKLQLTMINPQPQMLVQELGVTWLLEHRTCMRFMLVPLEVPANVHWTEIIFSMEQQMWGGTCILFMLEGYHVQIMGDNSASLTFTILESHFSMSYWRTLCGPCWQELLHWNVMWILLAFRWKNYWGSEAYACVLLRPSQLLSVSIGNSVCRCFKTEHLPSDKNYILITYSPNGDLVKHELFGAQYQLPSRTLVQVVNVRQTVLELLQDFSRWIKLSDQALRFAFGTRAHLMDMTHNLHISLKPWDLGIPPSLYEILSSFQFIQGSVTLHTLELSHFACYSDLKRTEWLLLSISSTIWSREVIQVATQQEWFLWGLHSQLTSQFSHMSVI